MSKAVSKAEEQRGARFNERVLSNVLALGGAAVADAWRPSADITTPCGLLRVTPIDTWHSQVVWPPDAIHRRRSCRDRLVSRTLPGDEMPTTPNVPYRPAGLIADALDDYVRRGLISAWECKVIGRYDRYLLRRGEGVTTFGDDREHPATDPALVEEFLRDGVLPCFPPPRVAP